MYYSTKNQSPTVTIKEAISHSVAPDGGLYMPASNPKFPQAVFKNLSEMSLSEIAYLINNSFLNRLLPSSAIKGLCETSFNFPIPLKKIEDNIYVLEAFHGPTLGIKDIGTRYLARLLSLLHMGEQSPLNVLVATNGNSGSAVANGFHGVKGVNVFALYPQDTPAERVAMFATLGDNVHALKVNGSIDNCRSMITQALSDKKLNEDINFTCANSTNIGRVIPLTVAFFHAYAQLHGIDSKAKAPRFAIPCGNGGTLLAAALTKRMGLPIDGIIAACNSNGAFARFINQEPTTAADMTTHRTLAYAMDTCTPSNAPRFMEICKGDLSKLRSEITAAIVDDNTIKETIQELHQRTGYILDPHSAIAYRSLKDNLGPSETGIFLATAHPSRSQKLITELTGTNAEPPSQLKRLKKTSAYPPQLAPTYPALRKYIKKVLNLD